MITGTGAIVNDENSERTRRPEITIMPVSTSLLERSHSNVVHRVQHQLSEAASAARQMAELASDLDRRSSLADLHRKLSRQNFYLT